MVAAWIMGGLAAVIAVLGLFLAAGAEEAIVYYTGLLFFVCAIVYVFSLIARHAGRDGE